MHSQVPLQPGLIDHDIAYGTTITVAESESDISDITWASYVYCEDMGENLLHRTVYTFSFL